MGKQDAGTRIAGCIFSFAIAFVLASVIVACVFCGIFGMGLGGFFREAPSWATGLLNWAILLVPVAILFVLWWAIYKVQFAQKARTSVATPEQTIAQTNNKLCGKCGVGNTSDASFCHECGAPLEGVPRT